MRAADVTIAIATYNGERFVTEALESALATGARVVVSDDGSTDATPALLERYAGRAEVVRQPRNLGIGANYQFLLERCQTPLGLLLNQDDVVLPDALRRVPAEPDEVTVLNGWVLDDAGRRVRSIYRRPPYRASRFGVFRGLTVENFVRSPSQVVFPAAAARAVGGFAPPASAGQGAEDWMCWLRLAAAGTRFVLRLRRAVGYRVHAGNYSNETVSLGASRRAVRDALPAGPPRDRRLRWAW